MRNIHALKEMVNVQELEYDFEYYQMRLPVDVPTIVISPSESSASMINGTDAVVPLRMTATPREAPPLHPEMAEAGTCQLIRCTLHALPSEPRTGP